MTDLREAIHSGLVLHFSNLEPWALGVPEVLSGLCDDATGYIMEQIEAHVGATQEKLWDNLQVARTEKAHVERERDALAEQIRTLMAERVEREEAE